MKRHLGLAIGQDSVRAVLVKGECVIWAGESPRDPGTSCAAAIRPVLEAVPVGRWRRPKVTAAVGPHAAQLKCVAGLPPSQDPGILAAIVRESSSSFFLRNGIPLVVTGARPVEEGRAWVGAIESTALDEVRAGCAEAGFRLGAVVPTVAVLPRAVRLPRFSWTDGPIHVLVECSAEGLSAVRYGPTEVTDTAIGPADPVEAVLAIGEGAARFADAYGAAVERDTALAVSPDGTPARGTPTMAGTLAAPAAVLTVALALALLSPMVSIWRADRIEGELRRLHGSEAWTAMEATTVELRPVTAALDEIGRFSRSRVLRSRQLEDLAGALPEGTAMTRFSAGGGRVELGVITSSVDTVLSALHAMPWVSSVEIVDRVERPAELFERATIALGIRAHPPTNVEPEEVP